MTNIIKFVLGTCSLKSLNSIYYILLYGITFKYKILRDLLPSKIVSEDEISDHRGRQNFLTQKIIFFACPPHHKTVL